MARPHICFIQCQGLPWQASDLTAIRPGVQCKTLSRDPDTGASTQIARYPDKFAQTSGQVLTVAEELFVLDGEITLGEQHFHPHCYAYLPAGYKRPALTSTGAVVLTMLTGRIDATLPNPGAAEDPAIEFLDPFTMPWAGGAVGSVAGKPLAPTLATKMLRRDPDSGEQTFLYCSQPHHPPPSKVMPGKFSHPMVEEIFVLGGTFVFGDVGVMGPGGYCYWQENEWHGPVGSATGYHLLIRNLGGPLENRFSQQPAPFSYDPPYQPVLPEALKPFARPYRAPRHW